MKNIYFLRKYFSKKHIFFKRTHSSFQKVFLTKLVIRKNAGASRPSRCSIDSLALPDNARNKSPGNLEITITTLLKNNIDQKDFSIFQQREVPAAETFWLDQSLTLAIFWCIKQFHDCDECAFAGSIVKGVSQML